MKHCAIGSSADSYMVEFSAACSLQASLTLAKALEIAQGMEAAEANAKRLKGDAESVHIMRPHVAQASAAQLPAKPCYRCGGTSHFASTCRFKEAICHKCKKRRHIARACRGGRASDIKRYAANEQQKTPQRRRQTLNIEKPEPQQEEQRYDTALDTTLFQVHNSDSRQPITLELDVQGKQLTMELDTGAVVSLISTSTRDQLFSDVPLHSTSTVLTTYTGQRIAVVGRMEVGVQYGGKLYSLQLHVVRGDGPNLLGRDWLQVMRLDCGSLRVSMVANTNNRKLDSLL